MTKKEKAIAITKILEGYYPNPPIPLDHTSDFTLLVAVLLSAQCTDVRVNQITPFLFKKADNPFDMVKLSMEEIREIIKPCGLSPAKSKAIFNLSHILIDKHKGKVPNTFEDLEELQLPPAPDSSENHYDVYQNHELQADRRDDLKNSLANFGIGTLIQWGGKGVHQWEGLGFTQKLPSVERFFERSIMLPMNMFISDDDVLYICDSIKNFYRN